MPARLLRATCVLLALALAGCSSMGGLAPAGGGAPAGGPRALDLVGDSLPDLVFALDLPDTLRPTAAGMTFSYDVNDPKAPVFLETSLVRADADAIVGVLPTPAAGRSYHVFALSQQARERLRSLQTFARGLEKRPAPLLNVVPRLCSSGALDRARSTVSVRIVLPGRGPLLPLVADEPLGQLESHSGAVAACG
jgi:hypothetical protein